MEDHRKNAYRFLLYQAMLLPNYCWDLSLIERLWKHLKATRVADVLFGSYRQRAACDRGVE